ncbi:MAG: glycerate kinase, partial [Neglectibacter timonensis]
MKKIILIPDSFKGTMSSETVCRIMSGVLQAHFPDAELVSIPVADGGEGSVDCFLCALGGKKKYVQVHGVFGEPMQSCYGVLPGGKTAVVELAACAGLPLAKDRLNPGKATTYGVGELLLAAAEDGVEQIILG